MHQNKIEEEKPLSKIIMAHKAEEVLQAIHSFSQDAIVLLDVDDTLITPVSKTFRSSMNGEVKNIIDEIKGDKEKYPNFEDIISGWRLQRKIRLTDPKWPEIFKILHENHTIFALTQMNTGPFGRILSMEGWRHQELSSLGLVFTETTVTQKNKAKEAAALYKGIMMTGKLSKSETLSFFEKHLPSAPIVFVDDRRKHIEDVAAYCQIRGLDYLGILFQEGFSSEEPQNPKVVSFQKDTLVKEGLWLEDDQAEEMMKSKECLDI